MACKVFKLIKYTFSKPIKKKYTKTV